MIENCNICKKGLSLLLEWGNDTEVKIEIGESTGGDLILTMVITLGVLYQNMAHIFGFPHFGRNQDNAKFRYICDFKPTNDLHGWFAEF